MQHDLFRLLSPRASFPADITPEESAVMREHVGYWKLQMSLGKVLAFGPVADPRASYGIAIVRVGEASEVQSLAENDPAILSGRGFRFEIHAMPQVLVPGPEH